MVTTKPNQSIVESRIQSALIKKSVTGDELINLSGNYDYLSEGYYLSQDYENSGQAIKPTCKDMLDAYVPPLFLEKAKIAGLPVAEYYLSNGYFEPPVIVDPINPFTLKGKIVYKSGKAKSIAKSLTRNFTYAVCCQELTEDCKIKYFNSVMGWSSQKQFLEFSQNVWETFSIPLARVRVIITGDGTYLLSDIAPLFVKELTKTELKYLKGCVVWDS